MKWKDRTSKSPLVSSEKKPEDLIQSSHTNDRDFEELTRGARTLIVTALQAKATEKDIKKFFGSICEVKDVELLRDSRSRKSKGIAYVELETLEDRDIALQLNQKPFIFRDGREGFPCTVKPSEIEKNVSHKIEKQREGIASQRSTAISSRRIIVSNIPLDYQQTDVKKLCDKFGTILSVELPRNSASGASKGFSLVEFDRIGSAQDAIRKLEGCFVSGQRLQVKATKERREDPSSSFSAGWKLDDEDLSKKGGVSLSTEARMSLMSKLAGGAGNDLIKNVASAGKQQKGRCILVSNMFNPAEETDEGWEEDIREETVEECNKFGKVFLCKVDQKSLEGKVFIEFDSEEGAQRAFSKLNGRWFDKRQLAVQFISKDDFPNL